MKKGDKKEKKTIKKKKAAKTKTPETEKLLEAAGVKKASEVTIFFSKFKEPITFLDPCKNVKTFLEKRKKLIRWLDKITFAKILLLWVFIIAGFGLFYFYVMNNNSFLFHTTQNKGVRNLPDALYFSFITATTTGFGDIVPFGWFKLIAILEVILGLFLLAFVTSKLVSLKQDIMLYELYEISFNERVNKVRSSLILFRQDINALISSIQEGTAKKRGITNNFDYLISSFENNMSETVSLVANRRDEYFVKKLDAVNTEIIVNNLLLSFERLHELIRIMNRYHINWRTKTAVTLIKRSISLNERLFKRLNASRRALAHVLDDLNERKAKVTALVEDDLEK